MSDGKLMWYTGDGTLFEHDDEEAARERCEEVEYALDEPLLVRITVVEGEA